jgi:4-amino-4-deoxy-L-arabinose transferase-like glycosyltransferase
MPNVLAWLTLGLATYALGRLLGGHRLGATFAALLVLLMPLSLKDVQTAHEDLALGAFFVASVYFTMHGWRNRRGFSLLMASICMAMMAGTKMFGLVYVGLVLALWLLLFFANRLANAESEDLLTADSSPAVRPPPAARRPPPYLRYNAAPRSSSQ